MSGLSDRALAHLREVADLPDLAGTRYEIVERVGRGGMGVVYRARDHALDRDVALKVLAAPVAGPETAERLRREARILGRLEHPGIVPVHDLGMLPDGRLYYTMKLVKGERLDERARGDAPAAELLRVFSRIAEAVAFAHAQGVIHRDLKPANVMIGPFGEVLVLDWGVAKLLEGAEIPAAADGAESAAPGETRPGTILGTPGYMAPEQRRGDPSRADARSDVYGLGGTLFFLLHSEDPPAPGEAAPAPRPRAVPKRLAAIVRRAMAEDPAGRYASVAAFLADVERYLAGEAVSAYRENPWERAGRFAHRYRVPILLVFAYLAVRVALIVWSRDS